MSWRRRDDFVTTTSWRRRRDDVVTTSWRRCRDDDVVTTSWRLNDDDVVTTSYFTSIIHRFNPKRYREKCRSTERLFYPRLLETLSFVHFLGDLNLSLDNNSPRLIRLVFLFFLFYSDDDDDDDDVTTSWRRRRDDVVTTTSWRRRRDDVVTTSSRRNYLNEICYVDADCASKAGYLTKYQNFANSKWRTAAILKIVFCL